MLATLEGYAVEGGFDRAYEPATCYSPTIALGRHPGPGDACGLWRDYERVLDLVPSLGLDGVRLTLEWARIEPRRGVVDEGALVRYREVIAHARSLGLDATVVVVDAAWPSWLGLEAWLLPWVGEYLVAHARRVVDAVGDLATGLRVFADRVGIVERGFLVGEAPPWRRGATDDAASALERSGELERALRGDPLVGPRLVGAARTLSLEGPLDALRSAWIDARGCDEVYVRSLVGGVGPSAVPTGLLARGKDQWAPTAAAELLAVFV